MAKGMGGKSGAKSHMGGKSGAKSGGFGKKAAGMSASMGKGKMGKCDIEGPNK